MEIIYAVNKNEMYQVDQIDAPVPFPFVVSLDKKITDDEDFLKIYGLRKSTRCSEYKKVQNLLGLTNKETIATIPSPKRKSYIEETVAKINSCLKTCRDVEYLESYVQLKRFLRSLVKPEFESRSVERLSKAIPHTHISQKVKELLTDPNKTTYSTSGTVTGRLTVSSGPNILTLPAQVRSCIKSKYPEGRILQIDLVSAEPYLALLMAKKEIPDDIYSHLSDKILKNQVTRDQAKIVTLSALYGQSAANLSKALPSDIKSFEVISKTKEFFDVSSLRSTIAGQVNTAGFRNVLGRPISVDHERRDLFVSYFLQSSIAELSILLFSKFSKSIESVIPYYVIHDALIFDCDKITSDYLLERQKIKIEYGGWKFQAKVTCLEDT